LKKKKAYLLGMVSSWSGMVKRPYILGTILNRFIVSNFSARKKVDDGSFPKLNCEQNYKLSIF